MRNRYITVLILLATLPTLVLSNTSFSSNNQTQPKQTSQQNQTASTTVIINIDGDVSLSPEQNRIHWNPHAVGLTDKSNWTITYNNETEMHLETTTNENGHIATGAWWTTSFKTKQKLPLYTTKPAHVTATFTANIITAHCITGNEWLRIALATAIQRIDGSVVYTEIDLWDSSAVLNNPSSNINQGGDILYKGGDVTEYKLNQAPLEEWKNYTLQLTEHINNAWQLKPGDTLESVYFVIEASGAVTATLKADDLWITQVN